MRGGGASGSFDIPSFPYFFKGAVVVVLGVDEAAGIDVVFEEEPPEPEEPELFNDPPEDPVTALPALVPSVEGVVFNAVLKPEPDDPEVSLPIAPLKDTGDVKPLKSESDKAVDKED